VASRAKPLSVNKGRKVRVNPVSHTFVPKDVSPSHCKQTVSALASFAASNLKIPSSNPFPLSHLFGY